MLTGDTRQYEETRSTTLPTLQQAFQQMKVSLGNVSHLSETEANINFTAAGSLWEKGQYAGIVFTADKSLLTADKLKAQLDTPSGNGWVNLYEDNNKSYTYSAYRYYDRYEASNGLIFVRTAEGSQLTGLRLWGMAPGLTYYYCEYRYVHNSSGSYIAISPVGQFTTEGLNAQTVKDGISVTITANKSARQWNISYNSSLEKKYPDKTFSYRIVSGLPLEDGFAYCINTTSLELKCSSYSGIVPYPTCYAIGSSIDGAEMWATARPHYTSCSCR